MRETVELVWNGLLDMVYPPCCLVCGKRMESGALCEACIREFVAVAPPFCDRCGGLPDEAGRSICRPCETGPGAPYQWSQAMGHFGGTLREAILRFKYGGKAALAHPLGLCLARSLDTPPSPLLTSTLGEKLAFDAVVPVPLHPSKLRQRGFNQSERLARVVAEERGWQLDTSGVVRVRKTRVQALLEGSEREKNVRGAFACRLGQRYAGQSVLIVDDVLTTGSTVSEVARVIRDAGASRICIIALARGN